MTKLPHPLLLGLGRLQLLLLLLMAVVCFQPPRAQSFIVDRRAHPSRERRSGETAPEPVPDPPQPPNGQENHLHENEFFVNNGVPEQGNLPVDPIPDVDHMADHPDDVIDPQAPDAEGEEADPTTRQKRSRDLTATNHRQKRGVYHISPYVLWTKGIVPFVIEKHLLSEEEVTTIYWTMALISNHTCIRFVPWNSNTKTQYGLRNDGRIRFTKLPRCSSSVGNVYYPGTNGQGLYCCHANACIHEIGHALGLMHEQQHYDKDIIRKDWLKQHPVGRYSYTERQLDETLFAPFDLSSPMHYTMAEIKGSITMLFPEVKRSMQYLYFFQLISDIYKCQETQCSNFTKKCYNSGFVTKVNGKCGCMCPRHLESSTGCTTVKTKTVVSTFPGGSYAFPSPREGCPPGFRTRTINHTYPVVGDWGTNIKWLKDTAANKKVTNVLCAPISTAPNAVKWPPGSYCLYRNGTCPPDFVYSNLTLETAPGNNAADWEDVQIGNNFVTFHYCCRTEGNLYPIQMTNTHPMVLLMKFPAGCQQISGMGFVQQSYLTKDPMQKKLFSGKTVFPNEGPLYYRFDDGAMVFYFCYYYPLLDKSCGGIIKLTKDKPSHQITSPNFPAPYDNSLDCFWQITGPPGSTLLLTFDTFDLEGSPSSCKDRLEINHLRINYDGNHFCGKDLWMTVRSIYNEMELRLRTNNENQRQGFNATVTLALPENHCYDPKGKGRDYRGEVSYTRDFTPCVPWNETKDCKHSAFTAYDLKDDLRENFCRNPGNGMRPWCYTSKNCDRNYCDVCLLETPYDTAKDCAAFKSSGGCSKDQVEARQKCARTCKDQLPPRIKPASFKTKSCGKPVAPVDGITQTNVSSSSPVGTSISYTCKNNPRMVGRTVCLPNGQWSPLGYVCGGCPEGWTLHDNNCFIKGPDGRTHDRAKDYCIRLQAQIAEGRTEEDIRFLIRLRDDGRDQWMAMRKDSNQCYRWEDKTIPSNTMWKRGSNGRLVCGALTASLDWATRSCRDLLLFVCQRPALNLSQCVDFIPDCDKWIQKIPTACQEADFAKFSCPKTCYGSKNCQDPCASSPCQNGGRCSVRGGTFQCLCSAGYSGPRCEEKSGDVDCTSSGP